MAFKYKTRTEIVVQPDPEKEGEFIDVEVQVEDVIYELLCSECGHKCGEWVGLRPATQAQEDALYEKLKGEFSALCDLHKPE